MLDSHSPDEARPITEPGCRPAGGLTELPGTPWSVRTAAGSPGRPSLEVYAGGVLVDVVVATPLTAGVLRGACRAGRGSRQQAIAWGRIPADGTPVRVEFTAGGRRQPPTDAAVTGLGRWFWVALADGEITAVTVTHRGGRERRRVRRFRRGQP